MHWYFLISEIVVLLRDSDTLTDVSSLHDPDDTDEDVDDDTPQCTRVVSDDADSSLTYGNAADNLNDLTIPDFTVS